MSDIIDAATIAEALGGKKAGQGYMACCPAHEDKNPSLSISDGENGPILHCFAGCDFKAISAELRKRGLWPGPTSQQRQAARQSHTEKERQRSRTVLDMAAHDRAAGNPISPEDAGAIREAKAVLYPDWTEPGEVAPTPENQPYPVDAFPPDARSAIKEYQAYGQQPLAMVGMSALGQMALPTQGLADVARDTHLVGLSSLFLLIFGASGERKTGADRAFGHGAKEWQQQKRDELLHDNVQAIAIQKTIEKRKEAVTNQIAQLESKNKHDDIKQLEERLKEITQQGLDHVVPPVPHLWYEDTTHEGLIHALATGWPTAIIQSDEGGIVAGSKGFSDDNATGMLATWNRLWDGNQINVTRKQAKGGQVTGRRVSISLMMQPHLLDAISEKGGRSLGTIARCLVAYPASTMGSRLYKEPQGLTHLNKFNDRVREILSIDLPVNERYELEPPALPLSPAAFEVWRDYHDQVERELGEFGDYSLVADVGAKSAENAARIACVFHVWQNGPGGAISDEDMVRGMSLTHWHLHEALRLFFDASKPQELSDAELLSRWLLTEGRPHLDDTARSPAGSIRLSDILQFGPYRLRDKNRRDAAIAELMQPEVCHVRQEAQNKKKLIIVNPWLLDGVGQ